MIGRQKARRRVTLKPPSKESLRRAGLAYLERYASSSGNLRQVLRRRLLRAEQRGLAHDCSEADIEDIVASLIELGLLDDRSYAQSRVRLLHRRGWSRHRIRADMMRKGLAEEDVLAAFGKLYDEEAEPDIAAAFAFARRRRLGPYRADGLRAEHRQRDLASLGRQGFDYDTARRVIDADSGELP